MALELAQTHHWGRKDLDRNMLNEELCRPEQADRIRVAVIGGGANPEHNVGRISADAVASALDDQKFTAVPFTIAQDGTWLDASSDPYPSFAAAIGDLETCDVAFPAVHGAPGEDGTLAGLCEVARIPYVGCSLAAGTFGMNKQVTKLIANSLGVRTAPGIVLRSPADAVDVQLPVVVKPATAGSSLGVSFIRKERQLAGAIEAAFKLSSEVLVESVATGREIDIAVLETADGRLHMGSPLEVVLGDQLFFDNATKYGGNSQSRCPAPLTDNERDQLFDAARRMFRGMGCAGLARIDFFLTDTGPVLIEVNTMPGFTEHSQYARMFGAQGITFSQLLDALIMAALRRFTRPSEARSVTFSVTV
ncbi:D-alanine--D-alanine ligase family protein [Saccharopolyspora shandongensis]|uniref:D-alanine--D-alanine ligase family protein n=1 Tax=Saccharopolyspora shandongensis TaxID=418495 RepID=UPI0033C4FB97